jgi:hypothetical protein
MRVVRSTDHREFTPIPSLASHATPNGAYSRS